MTDKEPEVIKVRLTESLDEILTGYQEAKNYPDKESAIIEIVAEFLGRKLMPQNLYEIEAEAYLKKWRLEHINTK